MRLHPASWYARRTQLTDLTSAALTARVSLRELVTVVENHPAAVGQLHGLLSASPALAALLDGGDDDVARGRRIARALRALGGERGFDTPRSLVEIAGGPALATALASVVLPLMDAFGAHLTALPTKVTDPSRAQRLLAVNEVVRTRAPDDVDFVGLAGHITADSAKLRHLALLMQGGGRDALQVRASQASAVSEDAQWGVVAELLFELRSAGAASFVERHGDVGRRFVEELSLSRGTAMPEPPNWDAMAMIVSALHRSHGADAHAFIDEMVRTDALLPRSIPELDLVKNGTAKDAFEGVGIAGIQHLLPSLVPLIEAYLEHGAKPSDVWLLAKDYTNNPLVIAYLRTLGVHVMDATEEVDGTINVHTARARDIEMFARAAAPALAACATELILDDGAALIERMNASGSAERRHAVELTTKGHRRLVELALAVSL